LISFKPLDFPLVSLISFWVGPPDWLRKEQQNQSSTLTLVRHETLLPSPYYVHFFMDLGRWRSKKRLCNGYTGRRRVNETPLALLENIMRAMGKERADGNSVASLDPK